MTDFNIISGMEWNRFGNIIGVPSRARIIFGVISVVFIGILVVIAFVGMSSQSKSVGRKPTSQNALSEPAFVKIAFQNAQNVSVDPCVDFYEFTCGLWSVNNSLPESSSRVTTWTLLQSTVDKKKKQIFVDTKTDSDLPRAVSTSIRFYKDCIQQSNIIKSDTEVLYEYFDQIGGWPILNQYKWNESAFDWIQSSAFLIKYLDLHAVMSVYTTFKDDRNVLYLSSPSILQDHANALDQMTTFHMLYSILSALNETRLHANATQDILTLIDVESRWRKLLSIPNKKSTTEFMSIKELSRRIPDFDWLTYFQSITNSSLHKINEALTSNDTVAIQDLEFLKRIINLFNSNTFSKLELANLFGWFIVQDICVLIPGVLPNYAKLLDYTAEDSETAMSNLCFDIVLGRFSFSLDYLYVKNSSQLNIQNSLILAEYLKSSFQDIIKRSEWLDEDSRHLILLQLNSMKSVIGFPSYLNNKIEFDKMYQDFPAMDKFGLRYYFRVLQYDAEQRFLSLKVPSHPMYFILPRAVTDASAYFIVNKNMLVYPLSMLYPPFFYSHIPWYLNFGAIGSVIGHEMIHGVDYVDNQENNLEAPWFTNRSKKVFQKRAECFKDQYYVYDNSGKCKNNGSRTLRENIADSEGLHIAFEAYKKYKPQYTSFSNNSLDQMFFLAYANVWCSNIEPSMEMASGTHSLPNLRVNKAVSNLESFSAAFSCPAGSPMNPAKKCSIW